MTSTATESLAARLAGAFRRSLPARLRALGIHLAISATIFLISINWTLITVRILENMTELSLGPAAAFSVLVVAIVSVVMAALSALLRRFRGAARVMVAGLLGG